MILDFPRALLLLLAIPLVIYLALRWRRPAAVAYSAVAAFAGLSPSPTERLRRALPVLRALALGLCVIALARPQSGVQATNVFSKSIAIAMVVDVSGSMGALDLQLDDQLSNRLDVVKRAFREFVEGDAERLDGRDGDLIALVTFARYADGLSALTLDHDAVLAALDQVRIVPFAEEDGTAIGEAIVLATERLREAPTKSKVMILLTDGSNNAGDTHPLWAARIAEALGVKIYAIGAGTRGIAQIPVRQRTGGTELQQTQVFIDEYTLEQVASSTGGRYFRATDSEGLGAIYSEIDALERTTTVTEHYTRRVDLVWPFLLGALGLLVLEVVLINTRLRTVP